MSIPLRAGQGHGHHEWQEVNKHRDHRTQVQACHTSAADGPRSLHRDRPCHGVVLVQPLWGQRRRRDRLLEII